MRGYDLDHLGPNRLLGDVEGFLLMRGHDLDHLEMSRGSFL